MEFYPDRDGEQAGLTCYYSTATYVRCRPGVALGIVRHSLVAEIDTVLQHAQRLPGYPVITVEKASGQPIHHYPQIYRTFLQRHLRFQLLPVIAVDHKLQLPAALRLRAEPA